EQVGLGLFAKAGFDNRRPSAADRRSVGEPDLLSVARRVLLDREKTWYTASLDVLGSHQMAGALGRDHKNVDAGGGLDELEMDVEAVAEGQILARRELGGDFGLVNFGAHLVRHQHHHDVGAARGLGGLENRQTLLGGLLPRGAVLAEPHAYVHSAVAQIERVGMALAAEAEDGDFVGAQPT